MRISRRKRGQGVDPGQLQGQAHGLQLWALYHGDAPGSQRSVKFRQPLMGVMPNRLIDVPLVMAG
jgi:hypothetical protein